MFTSCYFLGHNIILTRRTFFQKVYALNHGYIVISITFTGCIMLVGLNIFRCCQSYAYKGKRTLFYM